MDGLPGVIASDDDFGVNSAGMMVTETTIAQFEGWDPHGKPEFVRARKALQYSRSIDDFVRIMLDGNNGGYANDWLIGDNKTGEIALFELGLKNHSVHRTRTATSSAPIFRSTDTLTREETRFDPAKRDSSPNARKVRWEQLVDQHKGEIDLDRESQSRPIISTSSPARTRPTSELYAARWKFPRAEYPSGIGGPITREEPFSPRSSMASSPSSWPSGARSDTPGLTSSSSLSSRNIRNMNGCAGCSRT